VANHYSTCSSAARGLQPQGEPVFHHVKNGRVGHALRHQLDGIKAVIQANKPFPTQQSQSGLVRVHSETKPSGRPGRL
jgi:hypothetical protein